MNIGIILETNKLEKDWNGVRFANTALKQGHEVRLFLMSAGVEAESITHEKFNVIEQTPRVCREQRHYFGLWNLY
jgi:sulfur relay (sulfurtransferase) complex TusBCD TusD component (DsrE family)